MSHDELQHDLFEDAAISLLRGLLKEHGEQYLTEQGYHGNYKGSVLATAARMVEEK